MSYEMKTQEVEGKVVLVKSEGMGDWWCIERAEHAHKRGLERTGANSFALYDSARISDACVEGTSEHMSGRQLRIDDFTDHNINRPIFMGFNIAMGISDGDAEEAHRR